MSPPEEGSGPDNPTHNTIPYFSSLAHRIYLLKIALLTDSNTAAVDDMAKSKALQSNLDVDYVISFRFAKTGMFFMVRMLD